MDATWQEIILEDGLAQESVALLRTIPMETFCCRHLVSRLVHRLNDGRTKGLSDVTNAEGDDIRLRVHHLEGIHLLGDVGEQVVVLKIQEMYVY